MSNHTFFFEGVRKEIFGRLYQSQVDNLNIIMDEWTGRGDGDSDKLAAIFATVIIECGTAFEPVRETFAKTDVEAMANLERSWKAGRLPKVKTPYWRDGWFGRGFPQTTHERNYRLMSDICGVDFIRNPSLMLNPKRAAVAMIEGMKRGTFTGKKLSDYMGEGRKPDFRNARRIINGVDRAEEYARICKKFAKYTPFC